MAQTKRESVSKAVNPPSVFSPPQRSPIRTHAAQLAVLVAASLLVILIYVLIVALEGLYKS